MGHSSNLRLFQSFGGPRGIMNFTIVYSHFLMEKRPGHVFVDVQLRWNS
jgi:hypothetical protein